MSTLEIIALFGSGALFGWGVAWLQRGFDDLHIMNASRVERAVMQAIKER